MGLGLLELGGEGVSHGCGPYLGMSCLAAVVISDTITCVRSYWVSLVFPNICPNGRGEYERLSLRQAGCELHLDLTCHTCSKQLIFKGTYFKNFICFTKTALCQEAVSVVGMLPTERHAPKTYLIKPIKWTSLLPSLSVNGIPGRSSLPSVQTSFKAKMTRR